MRNWVDQAIRDGVRKVEVYINSRGGDPFEATEMCNDLLRFGVDNVTIIVGAVAASAATYFLAIFKNRVRSNSQIMIHRPSMYMSGDIKAVLANTKLLENVTEDYKNQYAKKTGKTPEEIETTWDDGDVWMTAQEAKNFGIVDEIAEEEVAITQDDVALLQACAAPTIPQVKIQHTNNTKMERATLIALYGLPADATDEQIEAAAKDAKDKADKFAQMQASAATQLSAKAETLVRKGFTDKKVDAKEMESLTKLAASSDENYSLVENMLTQRTAVPNLSAHINPDAPTLEAGHGDTSKWTLNDYLDKAPDLYAKMKNEDPARAKALEDAYFAAKK